MGNPYKAKTRAPLTPAEPSVPVGTIDQLIKWVGTDKDKAQLLLDKEMSSEKPRKSLTAQLNEILEDD